MWQKTAANVSNVGSSAPKDLTVRTLAAKHAASFHLCGFAGQVFMMQLVRYC